MGDQNKYSHEDDAIFDRLMNFPDTRSSSPDDSRDPIIDVGLTYSESDHQAFDQLLNTTDSFKASGRIDSNSSFLLDGYSDSDSSQFDELELVIDDLNHASQADLAKPVQKTVQESIKYSQADKQAFKRLMVDGLGESEEQTGEPKSIKPATDTSHIKIIDFDKEQSREKSRSCQGQNHIKIRYFD